VCPTGSTDCDGHCVDTSIDRRHCARCDHHCGAGECVASSCVCNPDIGTLCGDTCVVTARDEAHCGGCDMPCAAGERCRMGGCVVM
jgi:hypothetical protein